MSGNLIYPQDSLPQLIPEVNLEHERFYITKEELLVQMNQIWQNLENIKGFARFAIQNHHKIIERQLIYGDMELLVKILPEFLTKEFINPESMFKEVCGKFHLELFLIFDLCGE